MILSPDVAWRITLDSGIATPGGVITGEVAFRPQRTIAARSMTAALIATERVLEPRGKTEELVDYERGRVTVPLLGPTVLGGGELHARRITVEVPADAPPTLLSDVLQMTWRVEAWIDVGDARDPRASVPVFVPFSIGPTELPTGVAVGLQVDPDSRLIVAGLSVTPTPLQAGRPYMAAIDTFAPLPAGSHVDVALRSDLTVTSWLRENWSRRVLDARALDARVVEPPVADRPTYRYTVGGPLAAGPWPTVRLAHGVTTAALDVVVTGPQARDAHAWLPVAIGTSEAASDNAAAAFPPTPTLPPGWGEPPTGGSSTRSGDLG